MIGLLKDINQFTGLTGVISSKEGERVTSVTTTTGTTNTMHVVFNVCGEVIVDDEFDILHIYNLRTNSKEKQNGKK